MTFVFGSGKSSRRVSVAPDTYIDVQTTSGITYKNVRFIELNRIATAIRCVDQKDGLTEYPLNLITSIKETNPQTPPRVSYLKK